MKKITVFDTSLETDNLGDEIIMDAVNRELPAHVMCAYDGLEVTF